MLFSAVRVPAWPPAADDLAGETRAQPPSARRHLDGGRCRPRPHPRQREERRSQGCNGGDDRLIDDAERDIRAAYGPPVRL